VEVKRLALQIPNNVSCHLWAEAPLGFEVLSSIFAAWVVSSYHNSSRWHSP
jgi:hypothetical protein